MLKVQSCDSTWYFDPETMRFSLVGKDETAPGDTSRWTPYYHLEANGESGTLLVSLDACGRRRLRLCGDQYDP